MYYHTRNSPLDNKQIRFLRPCNVDGVAVRVVVLKCSNLQQYWYLHGCTVATVKVRNLSARRIRPRSANRMELSTMQAALTASMVMAWGTNAKDARSFTQPHCCRQTLRIRQQGRVSLRMPKEVCLQSRIGVAFCRTRFADYHSVGSGHLNKNRRGHQLRQAVFATFSACSRISSSELMFGWHCPAGSVPPGR